MMFLHTLRLAGDLSFYYAFAGFFAAYSFIYSYYFTPLGKAGFCAGA